MHFSQKSDRTTTQPDFWSMSPHAKNNTTNKYPIDCYCLLPSHRIFKLVQQTPSFYWLISENDEEWKRQWLNQSRWKAFEENADVLFVPQAFGCFDKPCIFHLQEICTVMNYCRKTGNDQFKKDNAKLYLGCFSYCRHYYKNILYSKVQRLNVKYSVKTIWLKYIYYLKSDGQKLASWRYNVCM